MQKALIVSDHSDSKSMQRLNGFLSDGWKVIMITSLSGAGEVTISTGLVIIENDEA